VGNSWTVVRARVNLLLRALRRMGYYLHLVWHVESNPEATGHHIHAWQRGDFIHVQDLASATESLGMGIPFIQAVRTQRGPLTYGMKLAANLDRSPADAAQRLDAYLVVNGGRLVHATQGFWLSAAGDPTTLRQATRQGHNRPQNWIRSGG